jgi:hypothetical protein
MVSRGVSALLRATPADRIVAIVNKIEHGPLVCWLKLLCTIVPKRSRKQRIAVITKAMRKTKPMIKIIIALNETMMIKFIIIESIASSFTRDQNYAMIKSSL